jgi:hypothetical protein
MPGAVIEGIIAALVVKYTAISSIEKDFFWRRNCECGISADHQKDVAGLAPAVPLGDAATPAPGEFG